MNVTFLTLPPVIFTKHFRARKNAIFVALNCYLHLFALQIDANCCMYNIYC